MAYSFNIISWTLRELKKIDTKIRKQLTCSRIHHPKSDVDRFYMPRSKGSRGMIQLELSYKTSTVGLSQYLRNSQDWMLKLVTSHENTKKLHSILKDSEQFSRERGIEMQADEELNHTAIAKKTKQVAKQKGLKMIEERWHAKPLHGLFAIQCKDADVDQMLNQQWLRSSGLKG